jgi:RNA polymerase sigma-70 factor (ECF subfamily)
VELALPESSDFADFYSASFDTLCVQLQAHTGSWAEAQDVVQEAFCRALARWPRISQYQDPAAWVRKVAWNLATSRWRRVRSNLLFVHRQRLEHTPGPDPAGLDLQSALMTLPPRQRQAIVLHYLSDVPVLEVAQIMGVAEGTVKSWLHRARTTLDDQLKIVDQLPKDRLPKIHRPGAEAARRTVRRRRDRNTVLGVAVLTSLAIVSFILPGQVVKEPVIKPTPTPSPSASPSPQASTEAQPGAASPSPTPSCISYPAAWALNAMEANNSKVGFGEATYDQEYSVTWVMCPGVRLRISWASYLNDGQGNLTLAYSGTVTLDNDNRQRTFQVQLPSACHVWFVTATDVPVPQTLQRSWLSTTGIGSPFWDDRVKRRSLIVEQPLGNCPSPTPTPTP